MWRILSRNVYCLGVGVGWDLENDDAGRDGQWSCRIPEIAHRDVGCVNKNQQTLTNKKTVRNYADSFMLKVFDSIDDLLQSIYGFEWIGFAIQSVVDVRQQSR